MQAPAEVLQGVNEVVVREHERSTNEQATKTNLDVLS